MLARQTDVSAGLIHDHRGGIFVWRANGVPGVDFQSWHSSEQNSNCHRRAQLSQVDLNRELAATANLFTRERIRLIG
jgi:hypothetical protein